MLKKQNNEQISRTATEARQAERGPTIFNVLTISVSAAIIALFLVWFVFFRT